MHEKIPITRLVTVPDELKLERYRRAPEVGPRLLFFSGGTALNDLSHRLTEYTHNSIHLVTPFDSGGSSAKLRDAFGMLSVGDMRSRMMALANRTVTGHPEIYRLFAYRLPRDNDADALADELDALVSGDHELVAAVPDPMRKIIRSHLRFFQAAMPSAFDLRSASVGNLILAGGYLNNERHIDPVIYMFSKLVEVLGTVRTTTSEFLHLAARLTDGSVVVGQRNVTGKEVPPIKAPVEELFLTSDISNPSPVRPAVRDKVRELIGQAELICFPMGSFYSSVLANLLPEGVVAAIGENHCPKVFIPNTGVDPEQIGMSPADSVAVLQRYLRSSDKGTVSPDGLSLVVLDSDHRHYHGAVDTEAIRRLGVQVVEAPLVSERSRPLIDSELLLPVLLSLV
ncbi:GAK system CofD-like protein [bacterium]|nr:GAK system CofD-like protein [bacterium]